MRNAPGVFCSVAAMKDLSPISAAESSAVTPVSTHPLTPEHPLPDAQELSRQLATLPAPPMQVIATVQTPLSPTVEGHALSTPLAESSGPPSLPQILGLTPSQRIALHALMSGQSTLAAAAQAGVDRATLFRWRKYDDCFIAAVNACQMELQQSAADLLHSGLLQAAKNIVQTIHDGNLPLSVKLLEAMNVLKPHTPGPISIEVARHTIERDSMRQRAELFHERLDLKTNHSQAMHSCYGEQIAQSDNENREAQRQYIKSLEEQEKARETGVTGPDQAGTG